MILKTRVFGTINSTTGSRAGSRNIAQPLVDRLLSGRMNEAKTEYVALRTRTSLTTAEHIAFSLENQSVVNDPANVRPVLRKLLSDVGVARYQAVKLGLPEAFGAFMTVGSLTGIAEGGTRAVVGAIVGIVFAAATYGIHMFRSRIKQITLTPEENALVDRMLTGHNWTAGQDVAIRMGQIRHLNRRDLNYSLSILGARK